MALNNILCTCCFWNKFLLVRPCWFTSVRTMFDKLSVPRACLLLMTWSIGLWVSIRCKEWVRWILWGWRWDWVCGCLGNTWAGSDVWTPPVMSKSSSVATGMLIIVLAVPETNTPPFGKETDDEEWPEPEADVCAWPELLRASVWDPEWVTLGVESPTKHKTLCLRHELS